MVLSAYRGLSALAGPLVPILLDRRQARGKEDPARRGERLGEASVARPPGPLVWIHGASVGEALAVQVLIKRLLARDAQLSVLLTTGTVTSAALMAQRLPDRAVHQYVPVDRMAYVRRFLDHWRPDMVIWTESELWPNLLTGVGGLGVPTALVNARMSPRSYVRWRRLPAVFRRLVGVFRVVLPCDEPTARRFETLGVERLGPIGNLKFASDVPAADPAALRAQTAATQRRPVWLACSTHVGEETIAAEAHQRLSASIPDLLTVIAPRHPDRRDDILAELGVTGLAVAQRSRGELPTADTAIYLADTMGEMGTLLRVAPVVFIGGSLVPRGGQTPIEAAQLGAALVYGRHMTNFSDVVGQLEAAGAGWPADDTAGLVGALSRLLTDDDERERRSAAARSVADANLGILDRVLAVLDPLLTAANHDRAA